MNSAGFLSVDFENWFPFKFWVSSWGIDGSYPEGFRYKILTSHNPKQDLADFVLLLEERNGHKEEMKHFEVSPAQVEAFAETFVEGLSKSYGIDFEEQDYTKARTSEEFQKLLESYGGHSFSIQ